MIKKFVRFEMLLQVTFLVLGLTLNISAIAVEKIWNTINQGKAWTEETRSKFYSLDQGSRIMPLKWMVALKQTNGTPFMADSLSRYGYLLNEYNKSHELPVGFTVSNDGNGEIIGMTCAACHTRQIVVKDTIYRIDGGPAIVDFQNFLADLDTSVAHTLKDPAAFLEFAKAVISSAVSPDQEAKLRKEVEDWYLPYHTLMDRALPQPQWGPGRLDAVSMIFNRLTGLNLGPPPTYIMEDNIKRANAPVRYPFLWNATLQDKTQWLGFADNGNKILGLARNVGEVMGVFAVFHPTKDKGGLLGINYISHNSVNFKNLDLLEKLVGKIGKPEWPWEIDNSLTTQGHQLYNQYCANGCHEIRKGSFRTPIRETWKTPIQDVGSDSRAHSILQRNVNPGVLTGASIPVLHSSPLSNPDAPINVLGISVLGAITQHAVPLLKKNDLNEKMPLSSMTIKSDSFAFSKFISENKSLMGAFKEEKQNISNKNIEMQPLQNERITAPYEAKVLSGIWASAPYMHNGSVPTLAELLKPATERVSSFKIGPAYDPVNIGLAVEQAAFQHILQTTDCSDRDSGNSRCGHEFGVDLTPSQKRALLEYLKTL